jgi:hypothetical protein
VTEKEIGTVGEESRRDDALDGRQIDGGIVHAEVVSLHGYHEQRK